MSNDVMPCTPYIWDRMLRAIIRIGEALVMAGSALTFGLPTSSFSITFHMIYWAPGTHPGRSRRPFTPAGRGDQYPTNSDPARIPHPATPRPVSARPRRHWLRVEQLTRPDPIGAFHPDRGRIV